MSDTHWLVLASLLAAWPAPLRERMRSTEGSDVQEHARDRGVCSASAADGLTSTAALAQHPRMQRVQHANMSLRNRPAQGETERLLDQVDAAMRRDASSNDTHAAVYALAAHLGNGTPRRATVCAIKAAYFCIRRPRKHARDIDAATANNVSVGSLKTWKQKITRAIESECLQAAQEAAAEAKAEEEARVAAEAAAKAKAKEEVAAAAKAAQSQAPPLPSAHPIPTIPSCRPRVAVRAASIDAGLRDGRLHFAVLSYAQPKGRGGSGAASSSQ